MSDQSDHKNKNTEKSVEKNESSRKEPKEALRDLDWLKGFAEKAINENQRVKVNPEFILEVCKVIERGQERYVEVSNTAHLRRKILELSNEQYNEIDIRLKEILNILEKDLNSQNIPQVREAIIKLKSMIGWRDVQKAKYNRAEKMLDTNDVNNTSE